MEAQTARVSMLIRRPPVEIFDAFASEKITQFWLSRTSGPLTAGARVEWQFMVPGVKSEIVVSAFEPPHRLCWTWSDGRKAELTFDAFDTDSTRVAVRESGFTGEKAASDVATAVEGYSIVLCDLKTLLESGRSANLVRDKAALITASLSK